MSEWTPGDAKRFAKQVELGKTYYTIETTVNPWGDELVWRPWVFDHRQVITGTPMSGAVSAVGACQRYGPMYDVRPGRHIRPLFAEDDGAVYATPADILKVRESHRKKMARR